MTYATLSEAIFEAFRKYPDDINCAESAAGGLGDCWIMAPGTPKDVLLYLKFSHNDFHQGRCQNTLRVTLSGNPYQSST